MTIQKKDMRNLKLIMLSLPVICSFQVSAQSGYYRDALRYSQTNWATGSTARMQGLAGAQVSLGGDMSLATSNPAGLGFFNRSVATLSLGLESESSDDEFAGVTTSNFKTTYSINNAGVVINYNKGRFTEEKFKGGSFGISLTRINDFSRAYQYEGVSGTSLLDWVLVNLNNGIGGDLEDGFYDQFLVDQFAYSATDPDETDYFPLSEGIILPNQNGDFSAWGSSIRSTPYQQEFISEKGSQYQFSLSGGGNYDDKIYFGGGLGFQVLYFQQKREYEENNFLDAAGTIDPLITSFTLQDQLVARGAGINASFGIIVRPAQLFTLGISYQSPTVLTINEKSDFTLTTDWGNFGYKDLNIDSIIYNLQSDIGPYSSPITKTKYKLKTPHRVNVGATVFFGKIGFISGNIEVVNYRLATLQSRDFSPSDANAILDSYGSSLQYQIGTEFRLSNIRLRGGLVLPGSTKSYSDGRYLTFGVGYRTVDYFVDLAVLSHHESHPPLVTYQPYSLDQHNLTVSSRVNRSRITLSAGFNF